MKYNLNSDYNFEETEIIAPEKLVSDICSELTEITRGYVQGNIGEYDGEIFSFDKLSFAAAFANLTATTRIDVQDKLGTIGEDEFKYEFYLSSNYIENFKYRIMFLKYGIGGYPVTVVLEQGIADEIQQKEVSGYIFTCDTSKEFETLCIGILNSKMMKKVIQDLISAANRKLQIIEDNN